MTHTSITPEMIEAAEEAYMPFGDMGLAIQCALAAALQPPEAAPVQLPEPKFTAHKRGRLIEVDPIIGAFDLKDGDYVLYTEQDLHQVRHLLSQQGIKTK